MNYNNHRRLLARMRRTITSMNSQPAQGGKTLLDWINTGINAFLAIFTAALFWVATCQMQDSKRAADAAVLAVQHQISTDSANRINDRKKDSSDSANFAKTFALNNMSIKNSISNSKKSLDIQLASLSEVQKQFAYEHTSIIQVDSAYVRTWDYKSPTTFLAVIKAYGNEAIRLDTINTIMIELDPSINYNHSMFKQLILQDIFNKRASKEQSSSIFLSGNRHISILQEYDPCFYEQYQSVINCKKRIYVAGRVIYTNLVTNRRYKYEFCVMVYQTSLCEFDRNSIEFVYNENATE